MTRSRSKTTPPQFEPLDQGEPFEFRHQTWQTKSNDIGLHLSKNCMILASAVLSQCTRVTDDDDRQTDKQTDRQTDIQHLMTIAELAIQLQRYPRNYLLSGSYNIK